jgi:hypothetical protein
MAPVTSRQNGPATGRLFQGEVGLERLSRRLSARNSWQGRKAPSRHAATRPWRAGRCRSRCCDDRRHQVRASATPRTDGRSQRPMSTAGLRCALLDEERGVASEGALPRRCWMPSRRRDRRSQGLAAATTNSAVPAFGGADRCLLQRLPICAAGVAVMGVRCGGPPSEAVEHDLATLAARDLSGAYRCADSVGVRGHI